AEAGAAAGEDAAVLGEVDGQALLVHRAAGSGGGRAALRGRLLVDVVVAAAAVVAAGGDLAGRVAVAATAEGDAVGVGRVEQRRQVVGDRGGHDDAAHGGDRDRAHGAGGARRDDAGARARRPQAGGDGVLLGDDAAGV